MDHWVLVLRLEGNGGLILLCPPGCLIHPFCCVPFIPVVWSWLCSWCRSFGRLGSCACVCRELSAAQEADTPCPQHMSSSSSEEPGGALAFWFGARQQHREGQRGAARRLVLGQQARRVWKLKHQSFSLLCVLVVWFCREKGSNQWAPIELRLQQPHCAHKVFDDLLHYNQQHVHFVLTSSNTTQVISRWVFALSSFDFLLTYLS